MQNTTAFIAPVHRHLIESEPPSLNWC